MILLAPLVCIILLTGSANAGSEQPWMSGDVEAGQSKEARKQSEKIASDVLLFLGPSRRCEYFLGQWPKKFNFKVMEENVSPSGNVTPDGIHECSKDYKHCATIWQTDEQGNHTVFYKGCWMGVNVPECGSEGCISRRAMAPKHLNNSHYCCCESDFCNANFTFIPEPPHPPDSAPTTAGEASSALEMFMFACGVGFLVFLALVSSAVVLVWRRRRLSKPPVPGSPARREDMEMQQLLKSPPAPAQVDLRTDWSALELVQLIGRGRYGVVFHGTCGEQIVAAKVYQSASQHYFINECTIYQLPLMNHPNLLQFYGYREVEYLGEAGTVEQWFGEAVGDGPSFVREYWLLTEWVPSGTLQDFLKAQTVDWDSWIRLGHSLATGLAYLHSEIKSPDGIKPSIAHRDVNSRNVLVRADGTCVICDLGFAIALRPRLISPEPAEEIEVIEVGTTRYMSPEVLEGMLNLRDPETALKQVDVYALGLVLWELLSRCHELYQVIGQEPGEYWAPFSREVARQPTLAQMQTYICHRKVRPLFPPLFYNKSLNRHPIVRGMEELVEDCWDQDADARISAVCARERLAALRAHQGKLDNLLRNARYTAPETTPSTVAPPTPSASSSGFGGSSSEGSVPPNRPLPPQPSPPPVQPYQGLNPCQERNVFKPGDSSDDSSRSVPRLARSPFGPKQDPCNLDTILKMLGPPGQGEKRSNQAAERDRVLGYLMMEGVLRKWSSQTLLDAQEESDESRRFSVAV